MSQLKTLIAMVLIGIALFNAGTSGKKRWAIVAYWSVVSVYWMTIAVGVVT